MKNNTLISLPTYEPDSFLDRLQSRLQVRNDAALARSFDVTPALVSRVRNRRMPISASLLLSIHEKTQIAIAELRQMMGDSRRLFS